MKLLLLGSTLLLLLLLLLALSDGVLEGEIGNAANPRDESKTLDGKYKRTGGKKVYDAMKALMLKRRAFLLDTDGVIVKYTNIFLTAKAEDRFKVKETSTVAVPLLRDHAVNVLNVAFFFRHLLEDHYPKDKRGIIRRASNAIGYAGRKVSHTIQVGWQKWNSVEESKRSKFELTETDIQKAARKEIKEQQIHLLFEATQGRTLLKDIDPADQFKNPKVKEFAIAAHDVEKIGKEVRDELFKVGNRGVDNLAALGKGKSKEVRDEAARANGKAVRTELFNMGTRVLDHLMELGAREAELLNVVTQVVDKLVARGKQDPGKAKATREALEALFAHLEKAYENEELLKDIAAKPGPSGRP